jgi:ABC-type lipoprotein release transport system permease subunit
MLKYAWREIYRRKGRSIAAICSYALAATIFSVMISLLQYSELNQYKTLYDTGTHFIAFNPACCNFPLLKDETHEGFWANGSRSSVMPVNLIDTIKNLGTVRDASPLLMFRFEDSTSSAGIIVCGFVLENTISVANTTCSPADLVTGRFITSSDTNAVLIEESYASSHRITVGKSLNIGGLQLYIAGIINAGIRPIKSDIYTSYDLAEKIISRRTWNPIQDEMNIVLVESANATVHNQSIQDVKKILGKEKVVSSYSCHSPAADAIKFNRQLLLIGTIFIIIFIAVQIIRTHYASIVERKREIGILQSMGWARKRIFLVVVCEFFLQALIGGIIGIYITGLCQLAMPAYNSNLHHILCAFDSFKNTLLGLGLVIILAALSAVCFAFYIARIQPIKNLRTI